MLMAMEMEMCVTPHLDVVALVVVFPSLNVKSLVEVEDAVARRLGKKIKKH
jgi:hypothetical protein